MLLYMVLPSLTAIEHGLQVVVLEHDVRHLAGHVGTGVAHGDAYRRRLQGRPVVDAVPRHAHDLALLLEHLDDLQLIGRAHPGEHVESLDTALSTSGAISERWRRIEDADIFAAGKVELLCPPHRRWRSGRPVIIIVSMPALWKPAMTSFTPCRTGSVMPGNAEPRQVLHRDVPVLHEEQAASETA